MISSTVCYRRCDCRGWSTVATPKTTANSTDAAVSLISRPVLRKGEPGDRQRGPQPALRRDPLYLAGQVPADPGPAQLAGRVCRLLRPGARLHAFTHGLLPLTAADRKAAAQRILQLFPDWSDRALVAASACPR